jgi:hypothetical protein
MMSRPSSLVSLFGHNAVFFGRIERIIIARKKAGTSDDVCK